MSTGPDRPRTGAVRQWRTGGGPVAARAPGAVGTAYQVLFGRVLARIEAERAHHLAAMAIRTAGRCAPARWMLEILTRRTGHHDGPGAGRQAHGRPAHELFGRPVRGLLGLAAGFDKNATMATGLAALGFAFIEVGTVTARAQPGNDRPRLWRVPEHGALVNRMGFNNDGAAVVARRLHHLRRTAAGRRVVLGVNIGKSKLTPAAQAVDDYAYTARLLAPYADYLVVNVSSPNTPGLRDLQQISALRPILVAVRQAAEAGAARPVPVLVKIAPDLADADVDAVADLVTELDLAGVVAVNTTIDHDHGAGGMSGAPVRDRGLQVLARLRQRSAPGQVLIGVGGISTPDDARAYLAAGADVVQAYTGFVYAGPTWPALINAELLERRADRGGQPPVRPGTPRA